MAAPDPRARTPPHRLRRSRGMTADRLRDSSPGRREPGARGLGVARTEHAADTGAPDPTREFRWRRAGIRQIRDR
ncbi:hypothetical protein [Nocardia cyriacigeorgica]|uniref:hypothetical protein n=1 Tax=Nocardia cyriacigeorgica TaxID=135487 RepID=UPI0024574E16|nr:hypothetical protein [Nocardia cyriacigeorgica]